MAKKKKTREQKILADQRHIVYHLETGSAQVSLPAEKKSQYPIDNLAQTQRTASISYTYVGSDIRKTALVTVFIILAQIILFITINKI